MDARRDFYQEILGVDSGTAFEDVRKAYRRSVLAHHPDRFAESEKPWQELRMIEINEAFAVLRRRYQTHAVRSHLSGTLSASPPGPEGTVIATGEIGAPNDPAYAYYKQGFVHFSKGAG